MQLYFPTFRKYFHIDFDIRNQWKPHMGSVKFPRQCSHTRASDVGLDLEELDNELSSYMKNHKCEQKV